MTSAPTTCIVDLTMAEDDEKQCPDPVKAISTSALREPESAENFSTEDSKKDEHAKDTPPMDALPTDNIAKNPVTKDVHIKKEPAEHSKDRKRDMLERPNTPKRTKP